MEAAVLNPPAAMPELDVNSNPLNAELEVKKLQELVRKLERQNEQLRTRAGSCASGPHVLPPFPGCCRSSLGSSVGSLEDPVDYFQPQSDGEGADWEDSAEPSVLDELELLDFEALSCSDDETWLYVSPRARESSDESLTPLQWCRQVLDCPRSESESARRSLSLRLDQVSRWRSSLSTSSCPTTPLSRVGLPITSSSPSSCSTPQPPDRHGSSLSSPLHPLLHRTLSPVGKDLSPVSERTPTFLPASRSRSLRRSVLSPQSSVDSDLRASGPEDESISLSYKLQDLTDVQVMARLQEENLRAHRYFSFINPQRQDYASTASVLSNRRSQSFTFQLSAGPDLEEEDEEDDEDYGLLPPPQPRLTRLPHSHTFSSMRDWRRSSSSLCTPPSTPSTPPHPSTGFAFQTPPPLGPGPGPGLGLGPGPGLGLGLGLGLGSLCGAEQLGFRPGSAESDNKLRRSMPNLVRAPSMPSVPVPANPSSSLCLLRNSQSFDSSSGLARLHSSIPSPGQLQSRVQSVGNFSSLSRPTLKATAYVSPTIKGSASTPTSGSLQCLNTSGGGGGVGGVGSGIPMLSKTPASTPNTPRSGLPRPASFIGSAGSAPRSKAQPARSLLTPPKSLSTLSALRDTSWRDGCY